MFCLTLLCLTALAQDVLGRPGHGHHHHQQQHHGNAYGHQNHHQNNIQQIPVSPYIVNGKNTTRAQYPFIVSLADRQGNHFCGGSLIAPNVVISAAHCRSTRVFAYAAENRTTSSDTPKAEVDSWINHPHYDSSTLDNDIAILKLSRNLVTDNRYLVEEIDLPDRPATSVDTCEVIGWGAISENGRLADVLQVVEKPVWDTKVCNSAYSDYGGVTVNMMCAGFKEGLKDSCQGDSGGPLVINGKLQGIVSWGVGCARPGYPGVYTRVYNYVSWIQETLKVFRHTFTKD